MSFVPEPTPGGPTEIFLLTIPSRHSIRASSTPAPELPVVARSPMTVSSDRVGFLGPQPEKGRETRLLPPEWPQRPLCPHTAARSQTGIRLGRVDREEGQINFVE